ncbi:MULTISPECIES: sensor histidine kinase [Bacillus]|uniref:sensor histidine kinase n=1 Tax=Bacillus TaxID=1386 RepID=UPI00030006CB|nr:MULTISPECIES: HAMP domain-containing sensor histidine kinase [Bacillus]
MKHLSIKWKVTLWYTGLIVLILTIVLVFVMASADKVLLFNTEDALEDVVKDAAEDIEYKHGVVEIDDDLELFDDGVSLLIYDKSGELVKGFPPSGFKENTKFLSESIQTVNSGDQKWLVYDIRWNEELWIRGITSLNPLSSALKSIIIITLIAFPFFVLIAALGGYLITKRAFNPIQKMIQSANKIGDGNDLSQRINMKGAHDEIYYLAHTFDNMFDRLQKSFESEKQFTSDASHELRTPTSVIISQCEYALSHGEQSAETRKSFEIILKQAQKMSSLISQLLMFARGNRKKDHIVMEKVNISELTEIIVEELTLMANEAQIEMKTEIEPDIIIYADQTLMTRLLINLITNGISYGKENGWVFVQLYKDGNQVVGKIVDNGIGIEEKHQSKIWNRFYRVDSSRTSKESGNIGLGLSMVKWIVELHGGSISVESEMGVGSTFTFSLPIEK